MQRDRVWSATYEHILLGLAGISELGLDIIISIQSWSDLEGNSNWYPRKRNFCFGISSNILSWTSMPIVWQRLSSCTVSRRHWSWKMSQPSKYWQRLMPITYTSIFYLCRNLGEYPRCWRKAKRQWPELVYSVLKSKKFSVTSVEGYMEIGIHKIDVSDPGVSRERSLNALRTLHHEVRNL